MDINPSSEEVRAYAEKNKCDHREAKRALKKLNLKIAINNLGYCTVELKEVLTTMVDQF